MAVDCLDQGSRAFEQRHDDLARRTDRAEAPLFFRLASRSPYAPGRGNDNFDEMIWRDADPIKQESN
jgi:hypothetical protein